MNKPTALIVEDSLELIAMFSQALLEAGYTVHCLTDGAAAEQYLSNHVPKLLLVDLHLPHVSGQALVSKVRQDPGFDDTRIIVASADYRGGSELQDIADLVLQKPISFRQLRDLSSRLTPPMPNGAGGPAPELPRD